MYWLEVKRQLRLTRAHSPPQISFPRPPRDSMKVLHCLAFIKGQRDNREITDGEKVRFAEPL